MNADPALLAEGDRLARRLGQTLRVSGDDGERLSLIGRSLAVNLIGAFLPTAEQISRRSGQPLRAVLDADRLGQASVLVVSADGELTGRWAVADLLEELLYRQGRLHPAVQTHLQDALTGDEHHATRALAACLRSRPVLDALQRVLTGWLKLGS